MQSFLLAETEESVGLELARLLNEATPLIIRSIQKRESNIRSADSEDAISEARANVIVCLRRLRTEAGRCPIGDFDAYVRAVAYSSWALVARRRNPRRAALVNRLQYLLENRTNQRGFSLWNAPDGTRWAGFESWRGKNPDPSSLTRQGRLSADPRMVAGEIFGSLHAVESMNLAEILAGLLVWLDGPARLRDLTDAIAEWQGISGSLQTRSCDEQGEDSALAALADPGPSPYDELRWREYLAWLWDETERLSLRQRTAFLLHSNCLRELELAGMTSVRQAAERLEISAERMAEYWNELPLQDRLIATWLGIAVQQVINLRRVARDILGRAWHDWLHGK